MIARRRQDANRLSMLGALDMEGRTIRAQALLDPTTEHVLAAPAAVALVCAGTFLLAGFHQVSSPSLGDMLRGRFRRAKRIRGPSAWSEADMERLHFDHAHIGGALEAGVWRLDMGRSSALSLAPVDDYPLFGGGLLLHLRMAPAAFTFGPRRVSADELNALAYQSGDPPSFGSWSEDAAGYSFRSFAPNALTRVLKLEDHYLYWGLQWAREAGALAKTYPRLAADTKTGARTG
ncbi:MAG TPA: hypothetical protein VGM87_22190 [Roseomonas sp.]